MEEVGPYRGYNQTETNQQYAPGGATDETNTQTVEKKLFLDGMLKDLPADVIEFDNQSEDIKELILDCKTNLNKALKLDGGVSKQRYFQFVKEDKKRYLTIPANSRELIGLPGWDSLFSLLIELNVSLKLSNIEYKNPGSSEDTRKYFAGLANRISKSDWSSDDTFFTSATKPAERGRATVDIYALKKTTSVMNLEKYLPESSRVGKSSYIRHYLSQIAGSNSVESLKAIPDLINKIMSNWVEIYRAQLQEVAAGTTISIGLVVDDLTRKKKKKIKKDGKILEVQSPIHAVRVSESPFILTEEEKNHFQTLEKSWDDLKKFNEKYAKGIPVSKIDTARSSYKASYEDQMKFAQATGSFKSRRMEAFKELAAFSMNKKEMLDFKLTKKTREIALENFSKMILSYDADENEVSGELSKILINVRPDHIPEFDRQVWNFINEENLLFLYGLKIPGTRRKQWLSENGQKIHDELCKYFPSVATLPSSVSFQEDEYGLEDITS